MGKSLSPWSISERLTRRWRRIYKERISALYCEQFMTSISHLQEQSIYAHSWSQCPVGNSFWVYVGESQSVSFIIPVFFFFFCDNKSDFRRTVKHTLNANLTNWSKTNAPFPLPNHTHTHTGSYTTRVNVHTPRFPFLLCPSSILSLEVEYVYRHLQHALFNVTFDTIYTLLG